jgi:hypothetical protein
MTLEQPLDIGRKNLEQLALSELMGPDRASLELSIERTSAREFIAERIEQAISEAEIDSGNENLNDRHKVIALIDNPYVRYLKNIYDAINPNASLSASQKYFTDNLISVEVDILNGTTDEWEHAAKVATYINSCRLDLK